MTRNLTIFTVNHDTPEFVYTLVSSYVKHNSDWLDVKISIIDNSVKSNTFIDGEYRNFTVESFDKSLYDCLKLYSKTSKDPTLASAHHALTIDWFIKNRVNTDYLLLVDSDIVFTRSFENEYKEFMNSNYIMSGYKRTTYVKPCIAPWACFINMQQVKQYKLNYFDINRILYVNGNSQYDTGGSFYEDCINARMQCQRIRKRQYFLFAYETAEV